jgi:ureidoacrylate peracid hydrolase
MSVQVQPELNAEQQDQLPPSASPDQAHPDSFSARQAAAAATPTAVPAGETAVLVVDMVNDYLDPAGAMPLHDTDDVIAATAALVKNAQAAGALVAWVRPGHREAADGLFRKRIVHAVGESWGAQFHPALSMAPGEQVFRKRRYSAFFQTDLDGYLREHGVRRVVVCGVALNICVRSTVHDAFFLGYDVWVAEDACLATSTRERDSTLYDIETHFGHVLAVDDVIEAWR